MLASRQSENTTIVNRRDVPVNETEDSAPRTIPGSYSANFVPHPERVPQASQNSAEGDETPLNKVITSTPGSYRGKIRELGDGVMRTLDNQLKNVEVGKKELNTNTIEAEANTNSNSLMSEKDANNESVGSKNRDDAQAQNASEPTPVSERTRARKENNEQNQTDTSTGEPPTARSRSKAANKR